MHLAQLLLLIGHFGAIDDTHTPLHATAIKLAGKHVKRGEQIWRMRGICPGWAQEHQSSPLGYDAKGGGTLTCNIVHFGAIVHIKCRRYNC